MKLIIVEQQLDSNNTAIKAYPRAHMHRDSDLRVGMSAAPGYSGHMSKKTTTAPAESTLPFRRRSKYVMKGAAGSGPLDNKTECRNLVTSYNKHSHQTNNTPSN
jgi:hypothetical protein